MKKQQAQNVEPTMLPRRKELKRIEMPKEVVAYLKDIQKAIADFKKEKEIEVNGIILGVMAKEECFGNQFAVEDNNIIVYDSTPDK